VRIANFRVEYERYKQPGILQPGYVELYLAYGYYDGEDFYEIETSMLSNESGGIEMPLTRYVKIVDPNYSELIEKVTQADKTIAEEISRIMNNFLVDKGYIQGTVI